MLQIEPPKKPAPRTWLLVLELLGLLVLAAGGLYLLFGRRCAGTDEAAAVLDLRHLAAAEQLHHDAGKGDASAPPAAYTADLDALARAGLIEHALAKGSRHGYAFEILEAGAGAWKATATPRDCPDVHPLFVDETGVVREGTDASGRASRAGLGDLAGRVLDLAKKPIWHVEVAAFDGARELARAETDREGAFRLPLPADVDAFEVRATGPREVAAHLDPVRVAGGAPGQDRVTLAEVARLKLTLTLPLGAAPPADFAVADLDTERNRRYPKALAAGPFEEYHAVTIFVALPPRGLDLLIEPAGFEPIRFPPFDPAALGWDERALAFTKDPPPKLVVLEPRR
ncbi:MAG TPA: carboxypeptidase-like regulatory domain-containing protein [Planctomycetota bacterium]|nr:carboxypeptidase-like regulatory domain-containing protein [Planctomycetota bacterium]